MPGAAGRVDHLEGGSKAKLGQRRIERALEQKLLDEVGRLEEGVALAGEGGKILVEIA